MSYSGKTKFEFPVTRGDDEIILSVEGRSYFMEGRYGSIENSYPPEGDTEILSILDSQGKSWEDDITEDERDSIIQQITDEVSNQDGPDPSDYMDYE